MQNVNLFFIRYINDKIIKFGMQTISFSYVQWDSLLCGKLKYLSLNDKKATFLKHFLNNIICFIVDFFRRKKSKRTNHWFGEKIRKNRSACRHYKPNWNAINLLFCSPCIQDTMDRRSRLFFRVNDPFLNLEP